MTTDNMTRGDPVLVCRPVRGGSDWFPATIARVDADTIEVVYADFERQAFSRRQSAYVIRAARMERVEIEMKHAREDYDRIQDTADARALAELILSMGMVTAPGQHARHLARKVLGIPTPLHDGSDEVAITTNGTTRFIPADEPVFLIRGQDAVSGDAVRAWANLAEANGAQSDILTIARDHASKMDAWPTKKTADLPDALSSPEGSSNGK